jgi:hypothetical protein
LYRLKAAAALSSAVTLESTARDAKVVSHRLTLEPLFMDTFDGGAGGRTQPRMMFHLICGAGIVHPNEPSDKDSSQLQKWS